MRVQKGFTLIELMVAVAIVGILASIALPTYTNYVKSSNAQAAPTNLLAMKTQLEQFYADYPATGYATNAFASSPCTPPDPASKFSYACTGVAKDTFTITATGINGSNIQGWTYTINQSGTRTSSGIDGVSGTHACWITKSGGSC
jgi:type IV pilus assembly protein PilE